MNSMVILAEEPVVVDTGAPLHREQWLDAVSSVVDLEDVRWVFLSHDDGDHNDNLAQLLERAAATARRRPSGQITAPARYEPLSGGAGDGSFIDRSEWGRGGR